MFVHCAFHLGLFSSKEERAEPGGTAIPGQPVAKAEQAPDKLHLGSKISLISKPPYRGRIRY